MAIGVTPTVTTHCCILRGDDSVGLRRNEISRRHNVPLLKWLVLGRTRYACLSFMDEKVCCDISNRCFRIHRILFASNSFKGGDWQVSAQSVETWILKCREGILICMAHRGKRAQIVAPPLARLSPAIENASKHKGVSRVVHGYLTIRPGDRNVLSDRNSHEVDHQQKSVYDAEELEGGAVKVCQEDGETEGKE